VVSDKTGKSLPFHIVLYEGKTVFSNGKNVLSLDLPKTHEVLIVSEGYKEHRLSAQPNTSYTISLLPMEFIMNEVVVTDVHKPKSLDHTVLNVSKITAKQMEQLGAVDLKDALSFQNSIRLSRDNAIGSSGMQLMGIGGDNVKFLIDGVPVIGRLFNQMDLEQFNLENIKQVEVIKGPMSVIYGSNALAGTINIITSNNDKTPKANLNANYETDGQFNTTATFSKHKGNHHYTLSGGRQFFDGWSQNDVDRTFDWIPKEQLNTRLQYTYLKDDININVRSEILRAFLLDRGKPLLPYEETAVDQKYKNIRWDNSLNYQNKLGNGNIQMMLSNNTFKRIKNKYFKDLITLEEDLIPISSEQDTQTFNASVFRTIYGFNYRGAEALVGLDGNYEIGTGGRILNNQQELLDVALFTSIEKQITSYLLVRGGLRYAYNSAFQAPLLYSLQTKFNLPKSQVVKLAYGKGFRAPSLKELYLDFNDSRHEVFGNSNLLSETSHSFTGTYTKYVKRKEVEMVTNAEAFFNSIRNKIDLLVTGPIQAQYGNIGLYETVGGGISQNIRYKSASVQASFNYTGIYNGIADDAEKVYSFSPQLVLNPTYTFEKTKTTINLFYNYFGAVSRVFADTASTEVTVQEQEAYTMVDLTLSQSLMKNKLRIGIGARNLLGVINVNAVTQQVGAHTPSTSFVSTSPGSTFFINIRYEFKQ
jgi:outer membrane receptor for ferrienterochelin and colicins